MNRAGRSASDDSVPVPRDPSRSEFSGSADKVIQTRDVSGGIHIHRPEADPARPPRQLPGDVRGFVNRHSELERLDVLLGGGGDERDAVALAVITGTAGVGKTALALRWAHRVRDRFPDGQLYVNLRGYDPGQPVTAEQALERFLRALHVPGPAIPVDEEDRAALYRSLLADRRMMVVLDNAATERQVRPLLPGTADSLVIVTSRSRLSGLMARDGAHRLKLEVLPPPEAIDLVKAITSDYRAADDADELAELTHLCARLPLALRIAAERAASRPWLPLDRLVQELRDESGLWDALSSGDDDVAVRTVFAWSYRALPEDAARMFRLLGLHPGPEFGVAAAAALMATTVNGARQLLDTLGGVHLLEQSTPDRYQFHDLLRAYATDQAHHEESLDAQYAAARRVLLWYLHTTDAAAATMQIFTRPNRLEPPDLPLPIGEFTDHQDAVHWFETEWTNLVAATRAASKAGLLRIAWQLPLSMRAFFTHQNLFGDRLALMEIALDSARRDGSRVGEAEALSGFGAAYSMLQRLADAAESYRAVLEIRREVGDRSGEASAHNSLGLVCLRGRDYPAALTHFEQAARIYHELDDAKWESYALNNLAEAHLGLGRPEEADAVLSRSLGTSLASGDLTGEMVALGVRTKVALDRGETDDALRAIDRVLTIVRDWANPVLEGYYLIECGAVQRAAGQFSEALVSYQRAVTLHRTLGDRSREARALDGTGVVYQALGRADEAVDFHRQAWSAHRVARDPWGQAVALRHLADALAAVGNRVEAEGYWREALSLATRYSDPVADLMKSDIAESLAHPER